MGHDSECPICAKHQGRGPLLGDQLFADEHVLAYHAPAAAVGGYLGYLFVETRRHVRALSDRLDAEAEAEGRLITRLARALEEAGAEHVYAFVFDHRPHHHVHVIARYPGTPTEFWGPRVADWPDAPRGDAAAISAFCERLRAFLR